MPADEVHHEDSVEESRARTGPRHAAPKKPLITRLHIPAGKAMAIAAMPTAVLMGMGLTPTLASAKPGVPKNPFQDGPCVTAPDKDAEKDAEADKKKDEAAKDAKDKAAAEEAKKKADDAKDKAEPTPEPSAGDKAGTDSKDKAEPTPTPSAGDKDDDAKEPEPTPTPTETKNPLDPLGVGDAIKDFFTPDDKKSESPEPTPSASEESKKPEDTAKDTAEKVTKPVEDTVDKVKDGVKDTTDKAEDTADKAEDEVDKAADKAKDKADDATPGAEAKDPMAPDENGKKPFPCVVEKKADGKDEKTPAPIPDASWKLEASSLLLKGADYQGVVNLTTAGGKQKQALKYVISNGVDIGDLHQTTEGPNGRKFHLYGAKGSTSTMRGAPTTMLTESISGKLFGLIPITFDPEHPPPINIPLIYFTDVTVKQAAQFDGNLTVPGLHQSVTDTGPE
ncbi:hypothetical protein [Streptomyces sp. NPDC059009]|uniref:hypothetical protein n=1 Tax=Streptomyces sp. NPDC059009 TaxID=3346694 RepID=UPI0036B1827B